MNIISQIRPTRHEVTSADADSVMKLIDTIDLSMVKKKLMDEEEGQGWSEEYTDYVELRYRRYLCMLQLSPIGDAVPTRDIDLYWHQHILDTRAYADDCNRVFGMFIHHFPYFGMRGDEDAKNLQDSFEATKILYATLFGADYCSSPTDQTAMRCHKGPGSCHKCASGCGMKCTKCQSG